MSTAVVVLVTIVAPLVMWLFEETRDAIVRDLQILRAAR